ncbi:MAG TPA: hypothetical protein VM144_08335 [Aestuariivirga sp.]|nr:hypothetical protein [Aestuariivirga sp.]
MINPFESVQVLEKNHFLAGQNRSTVPSMIEIRYPDAPSWLLLMAAFLILATLAPVAVLVG